MNSASAYQPGVPGEMDEQGRHRDRVAQVLSRVPLTLLLFVAIAVWQAWPVVLHPFKEIVGGLPDSFQYAWYLGWFWHAVSHGLYPLQSYELNWPEGFGLMYNTSLVAESVLFGWMVPFTSAVFVYNLVFLVNVVLIGWLGKQIFNELGVRPWLSTWGGAMLCFMPFLTAQELGHMSQFIVSPVLGVLLLVIRLLTGETHRPVLYGLSIGALCGIEFYTSLEITVTSVLCIAVWAFYLAIQKAGRAYLRTLVAVPSFTFWVSLVGIIVLLITPGMIEFIRSGGLAFSAREFHTQSGSYWVADLFSPLYPSHLFAVHTALTDRIANDHFLGYPEEKGNYIGLILMAMAILLRRFWTGALSRSLGWTCITMFILSLGNQVHIFGYSTPIVLPWLVVSHIPFLRSALPIRFSLYVDVTLIVWIVMSMQQYLKSTTARRRRTWMSTACALALLSWLPATPYPFARTYVLPSAVIEQIGAQPTLWITPNFGYDMATLAATGYTLKTYNMYGFAMHYVLESQVGNPGIWFSMYPNRNPSVESWTQHIKALETAMHSGYILLTPFNPSEVALPAQLRTALYQTLGKPVMYDHGCELWRVR